MTIVSFGKIIKVAYEAADKLAEEGISCEIIDLRTVRPIDYATVIESVKKTNRLVCLEEAWPLDLSQLRSLTRFNKMLSITWMHL